MFLMTSCNISWALTSLAARERWNINYLLISLLFNMADSEVNGAVGGNTPTTSKNALSKKSRKRRKKRGEGYAKKENPSESVDESLSKVNYNIKKNQERKRKIKLPTTQNKQGDDGMEKKKFVDESTDDDKGDDFGLVPERKSVTLPLPTLTLEQEVLHELHSIFPLVKVSCLFVRIKLQMICNFSLNLNCLYSVVTTLLIEVHCVTSKPKCRVFYSGR
ncbi:hypothetical protein C0J52_11818 [Blattella germanica]|nr:hypothetical protein C0J52_11818 [Blattella germanica]